MSVDTRIEGDPEPAENGARWLRAELGPWLADRADRFFRARRIGQDSWTGEAGELFAQAMSRAGSATDVLQARALVTARALEGYAGAVRSCRARMTEVRARAAAAGLGVSGFVIIDPAADVGAGAWAAWAAGALDPASAAAAMAARQRQRAYLAAREQAEWVSAEYQDASQALRDFSERDDPDGRHALAVLDAVARPRQAATGAPSRGTAPDIGNTDGVPLQQRGEANWASLQAAISQARADGDADRLARLLDIRAAITDPATGQPIATLIQFDPDSSRYAVLWGDPHAEHVGVYVPGVASPDQIPRAIYEARNLWDATKRDSAVIMWDGYDNPDAAPSPDVLNSLSDARARTGGTDLTAFVQNGLLLQPGQDLTLIGHSYGSLVVGHALADDGLSADRVVVAGSPGMDAEGVRDLHLDPGQFYAERAPGDPIANSAAHGPDPAGPGFGGHRLTTNAADAPDVSGHSHYFDRDTESLDNIAAVVTDTVGPDDIQHPTPGDRAGDTVTNTLQDIQDTTPIGWAADHYDGPGSQLFEDADHLINGAAGYTGTATRNVVDTLASQVSVADILDLPR